MLLPAPAARPLNLDQRSQNPRPWYHALVDPIPHRPVNRGPDALHGRKTALQGQPRSSRRVQSHLLRRNSARDRLMLRIHMPVQMDMPVDPARHQK